LPRKTAASGVDLRVVVWIREFMLGHTQRVRVGGQLLEEVRLTSGVPQGRVLDPLLFLAHVNDVCNNIDSTVRLFAGDCIIYRETFSNNDVENLQIGMNRLGK
jgi:hypothetical protein